METINALKHVLKRKVSVTEALLVVFLITGSVGYGVEITTDFNNDKIIEVVDGPGIEVKGDNLNITNGGTISSTANTTSASAYGIYVLDKNIGTIINTGIISANSPNTNSTGIYIANEPLKVAKIENSGIISSNTTSGGMIAGNGIYALTTRNEFEMGDIKNSGIISGNSGDPMIQPVSGNGILVFSTSTDSKTEIKNIDNSGIVSGKSENSLGSGINIVGSSSTALASIEKINNTGVISGSSSSASANTSAMLKSSGSGVAVTNSGQAKISQINNTGLISGNGKHTDKAGNGILVFSESNKATLAKLENSGVISGYSSAMGNNTGSGIVVSGGNGNSIDNLLNNGLIKGTGQAIKGVGSGTATNNGILAGTSLDDSSLITNKGVIITLSSSNVNNITNIDNGSGGAIDGKDIINGTLYDNAGGVTTNSTLAKDSYVTATDGTKYENKIINGAGIATGALEISGTINTKDSIVNGYNTAVYLGANAKLVATNTIFNGGGANGSKSVIVGDVDNNEVQLLGGSVVNGNISLGEGDDTLVVDNSSQINGNIIGGGGTDILNLGVKPIARSTTNLNILHNISGMENININGNVTLFEKIRVGDLKKMTLESGNLTLRVDPTQKDASGNISGHALYNNTNAILSSTGGNLTLGLNGLGENGTLSFGGVKLESDGKGNEWLKTNSLVLGGKLSDDGKTITVVVNQNIPSPPPVTPDPPPVIPGPPPINPEQPPVNPEQPPGVGPIPDPDPVIPETGSGTVLYGGLNNVYKSIVSAGEIGTLANTTLLDDKTYNQSLGGLLTVLDQLHSNNPYAYTFKSTKDSIKLFEKNMSYFTVKPKANEWLVQGRAIYTGVKADNKVSGKSYYGFDKGDANYKTTTSVVGGLSAFEYGLDEVTSVGFVFGGNTQKVSFNGSSKIEGNSMYIGGFAKKELNRFKIMAGLGYQYTAADVTRGVSNKYDSFNTNSKYNLNSFNIFTEGKYTFRLDETTLIEPKVRLSSYLINQDEVNEKYKPGQLSLGVSQQKSNTLDAEVGVDFTKEIFTKVGTVSNILSLGVVYSTGDRDKALNGYILGKTSTGSKFNIKGSELPEFTGKMAYNLELEQSSGMIYNTGVDFEFAKNSNINVAAKVGVGYKF